MGGGILPTTIYKDKLYFLFGKENIFEKNAKGFSDFGGGSMRQEDLLTTACREASEEFSGFLGTPQEIKALIEKTGYYAVDYKADGHDLYRMHIVPFPYTVTLPFLFNNFQQFILKKIPHKIFKKTCIFEKQKMAWISANSLLKRLGTFRFYFKNIIHILMSQKADIYEFIKSHIHLFPLKSYPLMCNNSLRSLRRQKTKKRRNIH